MLIMHMPILMVTKLSLTIGKGDDIGSVIFYRGDMRICFHALAAG